MPQQTSQPASPLAGIYAAALTPLKADGAPDLESFPEFLSFLAKRGCHGALILGTTGEGPSFSCKERKAIYQAAVEVRQAFPKFKLLAGTGTPSLDETIALNQIAFELGYDGVVVLPPYYYRKVTDEGLYAWFSQVLQRSVEPGHPLFLYHIPAITGVSLSIELLCRLKDGFSDRFAGLKDSSGDAEFCRQLGERFKGELLAFTGNDRLLSLCRDHHGSGCITAMANLYSPLLQEVWQTEAQITQQTALQERISALRLTLERYAPFPPILKGLLQARYGFPAWQVRPPLTNTPPELVAEAAQALAVIDEK